MTFEKVILSNLVFNEKFGRKTIPFLKDEYFHDYVDKILFNLINDYVQKYNRFPTKESLAIDLANKEDINEEYFKQAKDGIVELEIDINTELNWLLDNTEQFCQERAIHNALLRSIQIKDDKTGKFSRGLIPQILTDALAVSFDSNIGHDFLEDSSERYDFYHKAEQRVPFDIDLLNKITKGGLPRKTLNICLAGVGVGKSLFMCHCAASNLVQGKNVLYITLELAEERVAERIDANLLNIPLNEIELISKEEYLAKIAKLRKRNSIGRLIIKEYPTACAGVANFRHLLNELKIKKNFIPDIVYIDYLNICISSRLRMGANVNSYSYIKAIAEELRGLAVENDFPIVSATQLTRSGFTSSDVGLEDTSESFGLPATADFMFALIATDELIALNQYLVKQLKNRYTDFTVNRRFIIGVDKMKMRLYDVEQSAHEGIIDGPVFDATKFATDDRKFRKEKFVEFK